MFRLKVHKQIFDSYINFPNSPYQFKTLTKNRATYPIFCPYIQAIKVTVTLNIAVPRIFVINSLYRWVILHY